MGLTSYKIVYFTIPAKKHHNIVDQQRSKKYVCACICGVCLAGYIVDGRENLAPNRRDTTTAKIFGRQSLEVVEWSLERMIMGN